MGIIEVALNMVILCGDVGLLRSSDIITKKVFKPFRFLNSFV